MSTAALDRHPGSFPDANAAFAVAIASFLVSPLPVYLCAPLHFRKCDHAMNYPVWLVLCASFGAVVFGAAEAVASIW
jgi:hypothetical protein